MRRIDREMIERYRLTLAVARSRPQPISHLEQFLMKPADLLWQAEEVADRFQSRSTLFLGDDDHVSILAGYWANLSTVVWDIDTRVIANLKKWSVRLGRVDAAFVCKDLREQSDLPFKPEAFYANPPFSSKNRGHGLRYWISRGLELCAPHCIGLIVMPSNSKNWIHDNWISVQDFVTRNGCRILATDDRRCHHYFKTNDPDIRSQNLIIERVKGSILLKEPARSEANLYR